MLLDCCVHIDVVPCGVAAGIKLENAGRALYVHSMGRNAWEDIDPEIAAMKSSMRPRGGMSWGRVLVGLIAIGIVTFVGAYYVPLYRAHTTLSREHERIAEKAKTLEARQVEARTAIAGLETKLRALEEERSARESGNARAAADAEKFRSELSGAIARFVKRGGFAVGVVDGHAVAGLAVPLVFLPRKLDVSNSGTGILCELAKAGGSRAMIVRVHGSEEPSGPLARTFPSAGALRAGRAASVVSTLVTKCGVQEGRLTAAGAGAPGAPSLTGVPADRVEIEFSSNASS
ncbi:MAG TPA: hypothetical protein VIM73_07160 [Polyangiaceae bacterium]